MSACILPIGPEFQDPPASENVAPMIDESTPALGSVVTAVAGTLPTFQVLISDPNVGDDLHVRWVADYPGYSTNTRTLVTDLVVPHPTNGMQLPQEVTYTINCVTANLAPIAQHQLEVIVADRKFVEMPANNRLETVTSPGLAVVGSWFITNLNCGSP